jgi:hypothetical protein
MPGNRRVSGRRRYSMWTTELDLYGELHVTCDAVAAPS